MSKASKKKTPKDPQICVFCGKRPATTRDHIPPKSVFAKPLPSDLITVPACGRCNGGASGVDERFRVLLSLQVGVETPETRNLWREQALRTVHHNGRLRRWIKSGMKTAEVRTPSGIILGECTVSEWDIESHDRTIERIARGLYFQELGEALAADVDVQGHFYRRFDEGMLALFEGQTRRSIGGGQFTYTFGCFDEDPRISIWLFQFHNAHFAGAVTGDSILKELMTARAA